MVYFFLTTYNLLSRTKETLESLKNDTLYPWDIVLVDNNSNDGTFEWAKENDIRIIQDTKGNNLSAALNQGIEYWLQEVPDCKYLGWLHNDMTFYKGWLQFMVDFIQDNEFRGKFAPNNSRVVGFPKEDHAQAIRRMGESPQNKPDWKYHRGNDCPWVGTADVFRDWGIRFDEDYLGIGGYEDWDLNKQIEKKGGQVYIVEDAIVWHEGMGTRVHLDQSYEARANAGRFQQKWGSQ